MLRPLVLAALAGLALAAAAPAVAAGRGGPGVAHGGGHHGFGRGGPIRPYAYRRGGRIGGYAYGGGRYGYGRGLRGRGFSDLTGGYGAPLGGVLAGGVPATVGDSTVDVGSYRVVTAPGIVERPPGQPVVYVLDSVRPRPAARIYTRGEEGWSMAEGGGPPAGARIVTLSVPRR